MLAETLILGPTALLFAYYLRRSISGEKRSRSVIEEAAATGMVEPASLHPIIDAEQCIACGTCIDACPEKNVLGLVDGKAKLIGPSNCIGHGACREACPTSAIALVFGTAKRGVDIPLVRPNFETNVPGLFIAGELGGMGLIRNAIEQGRQAVDSIRRVDGVGKGADLDLVIVGAGPAGIAASLAATEHGLRYVTLEQECLGGTVAHYPRGKIVMTKPADLPVVGKFRFRETTKEELLEFLKGVERKAELKVHYGERVDEVVRNGGGFHVRTSGGAYTARAVLLTIGRRGTPRRLGVPGEERHKVTYRLIDPEQYRGNHVLVVGGGDSALEAACSIAEQPGATVTLSYRSEAFGRAKEKNRRRVEELSSSGKIQLLMKSQVATIGDDHVELKHVDRPVRLPNDAVIVCAGGILPTGFLESIGVEVETKFGTA